MNFISQFGNYFNNLFANNEKYFFNSQNSRIVGTEGAVYLDVEQPYKIFNENPSVNQVIRKKSAMFSNMELKLVDKEGNVINDANFDNFINNINIYQGLNSFLKTYIEQKDVYGNVFIYKNKPSNIQTYPTSVNLISARYLKPVLTGKVFDQVSLDTVIKNYELYNVNGIINKTFEQDEILWLRNTDIDDPLVGVSPLKSLKYPITNTKYAYDYLNSISSKKGAIGILSDNNKSPMGGMPLKSEEKAKIENAYIDDYGVEDGKRKVIVSQSALQWQPMTYPTRDLLLLEQIDAYFLTIIDHFGLNVNIFSSKSQTFENVKNSLIQVYQDTIIPEADLFCQEFTKFLGLQNGQKIVPSFEHVKILQDNSIVESITQLVQTNILTPLQAQEILKNSKNVVIDNTGNSILDRLNGLSPIVANNMLANLTPNEVRKLVGLPAVEGGDVIPAPSTGF